MLSPLALGVCALASHAHDPGTGPFEMLADGHVLSQSSVHALAQDASGYLWIGTQTGLDRYDGYGIRSWTPDPDDPGALSHGFIQDLLVAGDGRLWIGSNGGLDRLDPDTGVVTRLPVQLPGGSRTRGPIAPGSLVEDPSGDIFATGLSPARPLRWRPGRATLEPVAVVGRTAPDGDADLGTALRLDRAGRLWLAGPGGLWRFDRDDEVFRPVLDAELGSVGGDVSEHVIAAGPGRGVTVASARGLIIVEPDAEPPIRHLRPGAHGFVRDAVGAVAFDSNGALWFAGLGALGRVELDRDRWTRFDQPPQSPADRADTAPQTLHLAETPDGDVWLSGLFGLLRFDPETARMHRYRHDPNDPTSPPPTVAENGYRLFLDRFDTLWIGGHLGGLAKRTPQSERFVHVLDPAPSSTNRNIVRAITEQRRAGREFVWVANQNHGVTAWERTGPRSYRIAWRDVTAGGLGDVRAVDVDPADGSIWLAGERGIGRVADPGDPIERVRFRLPEPPREIRAFEFVAPGRAIAAGRSESGPRVWLIDTAAATPRVDRALSLPPDASAGPVFDVVAVDERRLIAASGDGIVLIDPVTGEATSHLPRRRPGRPPSNPLFMLVPDGDGGLWAGSRGAGLLHVRFIGRDQPVFSQLSTDRGLPDETVYAILPDASGRLWLSTNEGIVRFDPDRRTFGQFTPGDGLQGWEFNHTAAHVGASGRYYFGGVHGWNVFEPERVRPLPQPPELVLTGVRINGESVDVDAGQELPALRHGRNRLAIEFAGLHFPAPDRIRYRYRLEGVDDDWTEAGTARQARYASLPPGAYRFEVRAANLDGVWSSAEELLRFEIRPAPWATPWAWALYAAAAAALMLIVLARHKRMRRRLQNVVDRRTEELRQQNELIDDQARKLEAALQARTTLFANVSHEFRTPLTLIQASIDRLAVAPDPDAVATARRYSGRLLRLVEQLLDLSRLRLDRTPRSDPEWRLDPVVTQTVEAFRPVADERRLALEVRVDGAWHTECPQDLVEKILLNLLSNAVKFTPSGGSVCVSLEAAGDNVELAVADTGPGIAEADRKRIFERFYRTGGVGDDRTPGSGIGLALVHEAALAAGGRLHLDSAPGRGSRFSVVLPARRPAPGERLRPTGVDVQRQQLDVTALLSEASAGELRAVEAPVEPEATLLVVEDNADLRRHLVDSLADRWRTLPAADGREGLELARRHQPDLIVSDLMMPKLDGFELLTRLRSDIETSHIPVLFLTARQDDDTRLKAFALTADGFLAKPFRVAELRVRLTQMLRQRERIQAWARRGSGVDGESTSDLAPEAGRSISERDRRLLEQLQRWLAEHYADPGLEVAAMADAVHVTPRTLQRKLKSLVGRSPAHLVRDYRMARARELLRDSHRSVTAIAHAVGYSSSQYFSRAFRQVHGRPPEAWRRTEDSSAD